MADQSGWIAIGSGSAGVATATKAAAANKEHIIHSVDASAVGAAEILLLQIKEDTTIIWEGHVHQSRGITFPKGISITRGKACSAVLAAGAGVTKVNLHGVTR
jgi:hypothetical protein